MQEKMVPHGGSGGGDVKKRVRALDAAIEDNFRLMSAGTAEAYLAAGQGLAEMKARMGYRYLGFDTWGAYLHSKSAFYSRTYLSYLLRLGRAGDLSRFLAWKISGSALVEYARATDFPEMIPDLIERTWLRLRACGIRTLRRQLAAFVTQNSGFRRSPARTRGRKPAGPGQRPAAALERMSVHDREVALREIARHYGLAFVP